MTVKDAMTFNDAMFSNTGWIQVWFYWLGLAIVATPLVLAFSKSTRRDALVVLLTNISVIASMGWLYQQIGYVRLLGIVHVVLWTPMFVYLWSRAKNGVIVAAKRLCPGDPCHAVEKYSLPNRCQRS